MARRCDGLRIHAANGSLARFRVLELAKKLDRAIALLALVLALIMLWALAIGTFASQETPSEFVGFWREAETPGSRWKEVDDPYVLELTEHGRWIERDFDGTFSQDGYCVWSGDSVYLPSDYEGIWHRMRRRWGGVGDPTARWQIISRGESEFVVDEYFTAQGVERLSSRRKYVRVEAGASH